MTSENLLSIFADFNVTAHKIWIKFWWIISTKNVHTFLTPLPSSQSSVMSNMIWKNYLSLMTLKYPSKKLKEILFMRTQ